MEAGVSTADTHRRILAAAADEFTEKGYASATTRGIASRAGVNEVTLFRHFGSKRELLNGIIAEVPDRASLEETLSTGLLGLPPREALLRLGRQWAAAMQPRAAWLRLQFAEPGNPTSLQRGQSIGLRKGLAAYIRREQGRDAFRPAVNADLAAEAFFVGIAGHVIAREVLFADEAASAASTDAYLQTYVDLFLHGLEIC